MLRDTIANDVKNAMRDQNKNLLAVLRLIMAAVKQVEVDERITCDDNRMLLILDKLAKQRKESIEQYSKAQRQDLVDAENFELEVIQTYLPTPLTQEEILAIINTAISEINATQISDMGKIMNAVKPKLQGRCDMTQVSGIIKARLQPK
jgi:uncharacterized protein YqeY